MNIDRALFPSCKSISQGYILLHKKTQGARKNFFLTHSTVEWRWILRRLWGYRLIPLTLTVHVVSEDDSWELAQIPMLNIGRSIQVLKNESFFLPKSSFVDTKAFVDGFRVFATFSRTPQKFGEPCSPVPLLLGGVDGVGVSTNDFQLIKWVGAL